MTLNSTQELIDDIKNGKMVILMDDENRENEGDLVMAASAVTPDDINFMITHARGLVCLTITSERAKQLNLPLMSDKNGAKFSTNFTVSIEAAEGVTTGISAKDRATTILAAVASNATPADIVQPGHIFPIVAKQGGVLHRAGHTEAGCDLARLAGFTPSAVICEIIKNNGEMARRDDLENFAKKHHLKIGTIADLIEYRLAHEQTVSQSEHFVVNTAFGAFDYYRFCEFGSDDVHFALVKGNPKDGTTTVRVHTFEPLKDLLGITDNAQSWSIADSLRVLANSDRGVFVWIGHGDEMELGLGLDNLAKKHHNQQVQKRPTKRQPYSTIGVGAQILRHLGVKDMQLLSSPITFNGLSGFDLNVVSTRCANDE